MTVIEKIKAAFSRREKPKGNPDPERRLKSEEIAAGRMMGWGAQRDKPLIDTWKNFLKSKGIKPSERMLGIAKYDLEQADIQHFQQMQPNQQPQPQTERDKKLQDSDTTIVLSQAMARQAQEFAQHIDKLTSQLTQIAQNMMEKTRAIFTLEDQLQRMKQQRAAEQAAQKKE